MRKKGHEKASEYQEFNRKWHRKAKKEHFEILDDRKSMT